jgi:ATP-dependent Clp protease ATP-binding subunit ClpA
MISLYDLQTLCRIQFPGETPGVAKLLLSWMGSSSKDELESYFSGTGINVDELKLILDDCILKNIDLSGLSQSAVINSVGSKTYGRDLLIAVVNVEGNYVLKMLLQKGIDATALRSRLSGYSIGNLFSSESSHASNREQILLKYGRELTNLAHQGSFKELSPRDEELDKMLRILFRKRKNNPVLTGNPGVGKTALVELLARGIVSDELPYLKGIKIYEISISKVLAGCIYRGMFEERFNNILEAAAELKKCILFMDEIHLIIGAGKAEGTVIDGANMLKPYLARDGFMLIGATTFDEYNRFITKDEALDRRFQELRVNPPGGEILRSMVLRQAKSLETFHRIQLTVSLCEKAIEYTNLYLPNRHQPDKTIDLLDNACSKAKQNSVSELKESDLLEVLAEFTGKDIAELSITGKERLLNLEENLKKEIIGQEEAIGQVARIITMRRYGIASGKPLASFLFVGDTGVGKTQTALSLAKEFFGKSDALIRIDLGEYKGYGAKNKLLGVEDGFVGSDNSGILPSGLRDKQSCLILFDEIEKADDSIKDIIFGLLDTGFITDSKGKQLDARQCIVVLTSNSWSPQLAPKTVGFTGQRQWSRVDVEKHLKNSFRPEFLARLDDIIIFKQLSDSAVRDIFLKNLAELNAGFESRNIRFEVNDRIAGYLVEKYNKHKGVRDIKRLIEKEVLQPIAMHLLMKFPGKALKVIFNEDFFNGGPPRVVET